MQIHDYYALVLQLSVRPDCADRRLLEHFKVGNRYKATYIMDPPEEQGWLCRDKDGADHWLSPMDGNNHSQFMEEKYIVDNFHILKAGTYTLEGGKIVGRRIL